MKASQFLSDLGHKTSSLSGEEQATSRLMHEMQTNATNVPVVCQLVTRLRPAKTAKLIACLGWTFLQPNEHRISRDPEPLSTKDGGSGETLPVVPYTRRMEKIRCDSRQITSVTCYTSTRRTGLCHVEPAVDL